MLRFLFVKRIRAEDFGRDQQDRRDRDLACFDLRDLVRYERDPIPENLQDRAMTELMANPAGEPIYDRTREHLGTTDGMCIIVRRQLIHATNAHMEDGTVPPNVDNAELNHVRHACVGLPEDGDWVAASEGQRYSKEEHACLCNHVLSMSDDADPSKMPAEVLGLA